MWKYARGREPAFRDMLGLLDAATRHAGVGSFNEEQLAAIGKVFCEMVRDDIPYSLVMGHIETFARLDIDITGPIRGDFLMDDASWAWILGQLAKASQKETR
jgi:hypothetical protein